MRKLTKKHKDLLRKGWEKRKAKGLGEAWNKGRRLTDEHRFALKKAWVKRKEKGLGEAWNKGKKLTSEHRAKARLAMLGKKHSEETKRKMSLARLGKKNPLWKGNDAGYRAFHKFIERKKGKASEYDCEHCGKQAKHWANIDHKYDRDESKYIALCCKCHKKFDGYGK